MPHLIQCHLCRTEMSMSDDIFARRIAGRKVSLKCRHCTTTIVVDATAKDGGVMQTTAPQVPSAGAKGSDTSLPNASLDKTAKDAATPGAPIARAPAVTAPLAKAALANAPLAKAPAVSATSVTAPVAPAPSTTANVASAKAPAAAATSAAVSRAAPPRPVSVPRMPRAVIPPKAAEAPKPVSPETSDSLVAAAAPAPNTAMKAPPPEAARPLRGIPITAVTAAEPTARNAPLRVRTPPPFPAVKAPAADDDAQEISVVDLLPSEVPSAASPKTVPAPPNDDVQEVSVVDLLPEAPPPLVIAPAPAPLQEAPSPSPAIVAAAPSEPAVPAEAARAPAAVSPFAQTAAYSAEIDLTPRAFAIHEAPPRELAPVQEVARASRTGRKRAVIGAVALVGVALVAAVGVSQSGVLRRATPPLAAAKPAAAKPATAKAVELKAAVAAPAATQQQPKPAATPVLAPAAAPAAEASAPVTRAEPAAPASTSGIPSYVSEPGVLFLTRVAIQRAERTCHRGGRAVGTAQVFATFMPNGRVSQARIEGEPIASAPVARCIKDQLFSVVIPKFEGASFTVSEPITLR